jgi:hypothetical protein
VFVGAARFLLVAHCALGNVSSFPLGPLLSSPPYDQVKLAIAGAKLGFSVYFSTVRLIFNPEYSGLAFYKSHGDMEVRGGGLGISFLCWWCNC